MSARRTYTATYRITLQDVIVEALAASERTGPGRTPLVPGPLAVVRSNAVQMRVEGREPDEPYLPELTIESKKRPGGGGGGRFLNCSNTQQSTRLTVLSNVASISDKATASLGAGRDRDSLDQKWFDDDTTVNHGWNTATTHFNVLSDAFHNTPISFNCGCHQNYRACVCPTQPSTTHVCKVFWNAPALGASTPRPARSSTRPVTSSSWPERTTGSTTPPAP
jgi:hypothetical protein